MRKLRDITHLPTTVEDAVNILWEHLSEDEIRAIAKTGSALRFCALADYELGHHVRDTFKLIEGNPLLVQNAMHTTRDVTGLDTLLWTQAASDVILFALYDKAVERQAKVR